MLGMIAEVAMASGDVLGESALWSVATQELLWIDAAARIAHHWNPATRAKGVWQIPATGTVGMMVETADSGVIAAADTGGVFLWDRAKGTRTPVANPEQGRIGIGYNDGKVDPFGRLWVGSFDLEETEPRGCLWLLDEGQAPRLAETGISVINGPAFSPSGDVLYLSDSVGRRILSYRLVGAVLEDRKIFAAMAPEEGMPDGLTVDADGCLWCAHWDGARVTRFSPAGERLAVIRLPVPRVTSVAFGGADLQSLFITSARYGLTEPQLRESPHAGALFVIRTGVKGVPAVRFGRSKVGQESP